MPVINGKYYMNPQYGHALERDRIRDLESARLHGEPEPSWLDHFLGFADKATTSQTAAAGPSAKDARRSASTQAADGAIAALVYNETSGLRPISSTNDGNTQDLHEGRTAIASVAKNLDADGKRLGKPLTAPTRLSSREAKAAEHPGPAKTAYEDSQIAAQKAVGDKNGPEKFYLDYGQTKPSWTKDKQPTQSYGPFRNSAGGGDVPKGAKVWIRVYD